MLIVPEPTKGTPVGMAKSHGAIKVSRAAVPTVLMLFLNDFTRLYKHIRIKHIYTCVHA